MTRKLRFFLVGDRPIQQIHDPAVPSLTALKYDWRSGRFVPGDEYLAEVMLGMGDVEEVDEAAFIEQVERLRRRDVPAQGQLAACYARIAAIEDAARAEARRLTPEERAEIAALARQSYALFAQLPPPEAPPAPRVPEAPPAPRVPADASVQAYATPAPALAPPPAATPPAPALPQARQAITAPRDTPGTVREALARLLAISWQHKHARERSNSVLFSEYLRRAAQWASVLDCASAWPFFDVAARIAPARRVEPALIEQVEQQLRARQVPERMRSTAIWSLHWALIADDGAVERFGLPPPYEPLLLMYERGGSVHSEHGFFYIGLVGLRRASLAHYLRPEPFTALDQQTLDAYDSEGA